MRRWALFAVLYVLSAALVIPATPLAADDPSSPVADPSIPVAAPPAPVAPAASPPASTPGQEAPDGPDPAVPAPSAPAAPPAPDTAPTPTPTPSQPPADANATPAPTTTTDRRRPARLLARVAAPGAVTIADFSFGPATVTVDVGDSVTWTNQDEVVHTATSSGGGFDTGDIEPGSSGSATLDQAGSFSYICKPHPFMKGTVVVRDASSGGEGDAPTDGGAPTGSSGTDSSTSSGAQAVASEATDGPSLPNTGLDALLLAGLGILFFALGALVCALLESTQGASAATGSDHCGSSPGASQRSR